jgi:hypothetical protein
LTILAPHTGFDVHHERLSSFDRHKKRQCHF